VISHIKKPFIETYTFCWVFHVGSVASDIMIEKKNNWAERKGRGRVVEIQH